MTRVPPGDCYFSVDIEADGPVPGPYSMLSFGIAVAARYDGRTFAPEDPEANTFYRELQPISDRFEPDALRAARLDRRRLVDAGSLPSTAMDEAADWVRRTAGVDHPVLVAFPLTFDWMFLYWYFECFATDGSPFEFSSALDMKTMYQQKAGVVVSRAGKADLPPDVRAERPHTHNALDDAIEQAELFANLFAWRGC